MLKSKLAIYASVFIWIPTLYSMQVTAAVPECSPASVVEATENADSIAKTLDSKLRLLESVLKSEVKTARVNSSSDDNAKLLLRNASKNYDRAVLLIESDCRNDADEVINQGLVAARQAFSMVTNQQRLEERSRQNYQLLRNRISSFRKAIDRIATEKNISSERVLDLENLNGLIRNADSAIDNGDFIRASASLSDAARIVEAALIVVRANETLFHEKKFESLEDAYQDEMETNRSYMRLLGKILAVQPEKNQKRKLIQNLMKQNQDSVSQSMAKMSTGDMEKALQLLEVGTQKLIKALRYFGLAL